MSEFESQLPSQAQLGQALDGMANIFLALLRRSSEYGAAIAQTRARQQAESDQLAALERSHAADRSTLEQLNSVFSEVAGRLAPVRPTEPAPLEAVRERFDGGNSLEAPAEAARTEQAEPAAAVPVAERPTEPDTQESGGDQLRVEQEQPAATVEAKREFASTDQLYGRTSSLTADDLRGIVERRDELAARG